MSCSSCMVVSFRFRCRVNAPGDPAAPTKRVAKDISSPYKSEMDRLPPLSAIRAFEAAGRHENFSRAADELGLTQAAVSYQIRQLEDRVGRALFVREKGRVRLSDSGRRLLPALTSGFAGIAEAFAALRGEDDDVLELDTAVSFG